VSATLPKEDHVPNVAGNSDAGTSAKLLPEVVILWDVEINKQIWHWNSEWGIQNNNIGTIGSGDASYVGANAYSKLMDLWKPKSEQLYFNFQKSCN